jgi:hypothetical protein
MGCKETNGFPQTGDWAGTVSERIRSKERRATRAQSPTFRANMEVQIGISADGFFRDGDENFGACQR